MVSESPAPNTLFPGLLRIQARSLFVSAIVLLCLCAIATYLSFFYFRKSEAWVTHTQEVRAAVGDLEAALNHGARMSISYAISGDDSDLREYRQVTAPIPTQIKDLCQLTREPVQVGHCKRLEALTDDRLQAWEASIAQKQQGRPVNLRALLHENLDSSSRSSALAEGIRSDETRFLDPRIRAAQRGFLFATLIVGASFVLGLLMLYFHYHLLNSQVRAREEDERSVRNAYLMEAELRQEAERFAEFIYAVKDYAIFTLDSEGRVSSWNEGAKRLKGYEASEILGKHFSIFYPEVDVEKGKPKWELEVATREGRIEDEGWRVRKDGSLFWGNVVITATRDRFGQLIGFTKVTRDFTERMRGEQELKRANKKLAGEIAERTSVEEKLALSEQSLRELSLHLLRTQDEERRRIGRDLHDSLGQYLAVLKMNLDSLRPAPDRNNGNGAGEEIEKCVRLAEDSIKEVRTISYLLYPPMLEEMGLKSAIPWYLDGFAKRSKIRVDFSIDPKFGRLTPEAELALFRVLQESLTNVHRHSGSSIARIRLSHVNDNAVLEIKDEGKGIPAKLLEQAGEDWMGSLGVGLRGMTERLRQLGGKLEVSSTKQGTTVTATLPAVADPTLTASA